MKKEDITNLSFKDNSFDIIFCSHVLEHIEDDKRAMKELYRVLNPAGFAILQVPILREKTFEDFNIKSPKLREKVFGQSDHVRIYGKDFKYRLENVGFKVKVDKFTEKMSNKEIHKLALLPDNHKYKEEGFIYLCTKHNITNKIYNNGGSEIYK